MKNNDLKNRVRFSTTLRPDVEQALKEHSQKSDISISKIVDKALSQYLKLEEKH